MRDLPDRWGLALVVAVAGVIFVALGIARPDLWCVDGYYHIRSAEILPSLPGLLVKDPGEWKHTAIVGGLTSLAMIGVISIVRSSINLYYFKETPEYMVACMLYLLVNTFLLSLFSYHLINPVRKRGWYWRDAHPGSS